MNKAIPILIISALLFAAYKLLYSDNKTTTKNEGVDIETLAGLKTIDNCTGTLVNLNKLKTLATKDKNYEYCPAWQDAHHSDRTNKTNATNGLKWAIGGAKQEPYTACITDTDIEKFATKYRDYVKQIQIGKRAAAKKAFTSITNDIKLA
jgi:hypothetical protein